MEKENLENSDEQLLELEDIDQINNELFSNSESDGIKSNKADLDRIRDRTFNNELSNLVSKITSNDEDQSDKNNQSDGNIQSDHEDASGFPKFANLTIDPDADDQSKDPVADMSEEELLKKYHELFYKAINLENYDRVNTTFNPFSLYNELSGVELTDLIHKEMLNLALPEYSILFYDFKKKCYSGYMNHIKGIDDSNIILDTAEDLFKRITENIVYSIDEQRINGDLYLKKRFSVDDRNAKGRNNLLLISFSRFYSGFFSGIDIQDIWKNTHYLYPVLAIMLSENAGESRKKELLAGVKDRLSVYLFLLHRKVLLENNSSNSSGLKGFFNILEYTYRRYSGKNDCVCAIVKSKNYVNIESLFALDYLQARIEKKISGASVSRAEKEKLIVFSGPEMEKNLAQILDNFQKQYRDLFVYNIFIENEFNRHISFFEDIKKYLVE